MSQLSQPQQHSETTSVHDITTEAATTTQHSETTSIPDVTTNTRQ